MNPNVPSIEQLKELALPVPVSYAPQTRGWWALLGLLMTVVVLVSARRYWQWRRDRYRREALARLAELQQRSNDLSALRELPELLQAGRDLDACHTHCRSELARDETSRSNSISTDTPPSRASSLLQGNPAALGKEQWQAFLQRHCKQPLPADFSQQLALLAYAPDAALRALPNDQRQQLFVTCKTWVEHHHVAA